MIDAARSLGAILALAVVAPSQQSERLDVEVHLAGIRHRHVVASAATPDGVCRDIETEEPIKVQGGGDVLRHQIQAV